LSAKKEKKQENKRVKVNFKSFFCVPYLFTYLLPSPPIFFFLCIFLAKNGHTQTVAELAQRKANMKTVNKKRKTIFDAARKHLGTLEALKVLYSAQD
jgi:cytochrome c oxidase assembly protein Cox11